MQNELIFEQMHHQAFIGVAHILCQCLVFVQTKTIKFTENSTRAAA